MQGKVREEIAGLFDSMYVSFYKDLGGIAGAMLLGMEDFIAEAKVWPKRHGGQRSSIGPIAAAARPGYEATYPQLDGWVKKTTEIAAAFSAVEVQPDPPHTNIF